MNPIELTFDLSMDYEDRLMWWYFLGADGGPVVKVFRGSLHGNGCLFRVL